MNDEHDLIILYEMKLHFIGAYIFPGNLGRINGDIDRF